MESGKEDRLGELRNAAWPSEEERLQYLHLSGATLLLLPGPRRADLHSAAQHQRRFRRSERALTTVLGCQWSAVREELPMHRQVTVGNGCWRRQRTTGSSAALGMTPDT